MNNILLNILFTLAGIFIGRLIVFARPRADLADGTLKADLKRLAEEVASNQKYISLILEDFSGQSGLKAGDIHKKAEEEMRREGYQIPKMSATEAMRIKHRHLEKGMDR